MGGVKNSRPRQISLDTFLHAICYEPVEPHSFMAALCLFPANRGQMQVRPTQVLDLADMSSVNRAGSRKQGAVKQEAGSSETGSGKQGARKKGERRRREPGILSLFSVIRAPLFGFQRALHI